MAEQARQQHKMLEMLCYHYKLEAKDTFYLPIKQMFHGQKYIINYLKMQELL